MTTYIELTQLDETKLMAISTNNSGEFRLVYDFYKGYGPFNVKLTEIAANVEIYTDNNNKEKYIAIVNHDDRNFYNKINNRLKKIFTSDIINYVNNDYESIASHIITENTKLTRNNSSVLIKDYETILVEPIVSFKIKIYKTMLSITPIVERAIFNGGIMIGDSEDQQEYTDEEYEEQISRYVGHKLLRKNGY